MANNYGNIIRNLQPGKLKPLYFLHGNEPYYTDSFANKVQEIAIPEHEKAFNEYVLYGKDVTVGDILNYAKKFPMMAERQLVLVKEAHAITDLGQKNALAVLENYARNPADTTVLVFCYGKEERKAWIKAFGEKGEVHHFKKMFDSEVPGFIADVCREENIRISPKAIQLLSEHLGNNPQTIQMELEKIKINLKEGEGVDADIVERFVGVSKEYNVFELQKALTDKNATKAFRIAHYFGSNSKEHPLPQNTIALYNFFSKVLLLHGLGPKMDAELATILGVNPYFVKDYRRAAQAYTLPQLRRVMHALRNADARSKGVNSGSETDAAIYKELIFSFFS